MQLLAAFIAMALVSQAAAAQWVPVTGRIVTKTEVIEKDGSVGQKWSTTSRYSRSSSGSVLVQRMGRSGKPASGTLLDYGKSQKAYSLIYRNGQITDSHHALDHHLNAQPPRGMSEAQKKISLGNEKINGVDCFIVPVYDVGVNRSRVLIGKAWMAPAYNNLIMREDVVRTSAFGGKRHIVRELAITDKGEPDLSLFSTDRAVVASHWKLPPAKQP